MTKTRHRRGGFAIATAMCMIAIAAVAMTAVCALLSADVRRTLGGATDTQLRQLLVAGVLDARSHLGSAETQWTTPLPPELAASGARVETRITLVPDGAEAIIRATIGARHDSQRIRFSRRDARWTPVSVELLGHGE